MEMNFLVWIVIEGKIRAAVRHYQEPEYQQPYAYPPSHAIPYNPAGSTPFGGYNAGGTPTSDHASEMTFTESELALTHQGTLPICNGNVWFSFKFETISIVAFRLCLSPVEEYLRALKHLEGHN